MSALGNSSIYKAYDVRGVYGEDIDASVAHDIGRAFTRVIAGMAGKPAGELTLGLGRDMRLQAPELAAAYRDGMVAEGATVLDAGQVGTEMLYFLVGSRDLDGGLMCTASHNPKRYTGVKLVRAGALALSGDEGIGDIRDLIAAGLGGGASRPGSVTEVDVTSDFQAAAMSFIDPAAVRPLKVVVDGGNGMAGPMVGPLLERLGLDLQTAYWTPDGHFPDHEPNPLLPENREFIMSEVVRCGADLGIAWDGDADRCFFIDETGAFVDGDFLTALLAESMLKKNPGATVLFDVRASRAVADTAHAHGGEALVNRVGHAFFKARMREVPDAVFGGEVSGHSTSASSTARTPGRCPRCSSSNCSPRGGRRCRSCLSHTGRGTSSPARSTPRSSTRRRRSPSSPSATPTVARATSTASRSTTTTGISTCVPPTPSRCCACAWSHCARRRTWSVAATNCSP
jgi:phosphomannomutase